MSRILQVVAPDIEWQQSVLARARLRAWREVLWMRRQWASQSVAPAQGLAIPDSEIDRLLEAPEALSARHREFETDAQVRALNASISEADDAFRNDGVWNRFADEFDLSTEDSDLLSLTIATELDPWFRRVCGYLHDDASASQPSPWLASRLFGWDSPVAFGPDSGIVRWRLALPRDGPHQWAATTPWHADPAVAYWYSTRDFVDASLGSSASYAEGDPGPSVYPELFSVLQTTIASLRNKQLSRFELELAGPRGAGKRTIAHQLCHSLQKELLVADAGALFSQESWPACVDKAIRVLRLARLRGSVILWHNADQMDPRVLHQVPRGAPRIEPQIVFLSCSGRTAFPSQPDVIRRSFDVPMLTRATRGALWESLTGTAPPSAISNTLLMPGEIVAAAKAAPAGTEAVREATRAMLYQAPGDIFSPLPCPHKPEDLVLPQSISKHLDELKAQARLRFVVLEDWGFSRLTPTSRGISALFAGPSGTGKTMAAQVIARELEMELYRVDLSGVVNKYIGETEKRLKQVFDACERSNVILFFDEADSLFGQRTDVKDAHDRYANIEVNYLLQRMEQFDGIAILATNRKNDLDKAFTRRLRFIVDFLPPAPPERLILWEKALLEGRAPGTTLFEEDIDFSLLAKQIDLTGAGIKLAALNAAFLAREEGTRIGLRHILSAVRREMAKHGQVLRAGDLGFAS